MRAKTRTALPAPLPHRLKESPRISAHGRKSPSTAATAPTMVTFIPFDMIVRGYK